MRKQIRSIAVRAALATVTGLALAAWQDAASATSATAEPARSSGEAVQVAAEPAPAAANAAL